MTYVGRLRQGFSQDVGCHFGCGHVNQVERAGARVFADVVKSSINMLRAFAVNWVVRQSYAALVILIERRA